MSDVEKFWYAMAPKMGDNRKWEQLTGGEQVTFVEGINLLLSVFKR